MGPISNYWSFIIYLPARIFIRCEPTKNISCISTLAGSAPCLNYLKLRFGCENLLLSKWSFWKFSGLIFKHETANVLWDQLRCINSKS